jgi:hypothetical protein
MKTLKFSLSCAFSFVAVQCLAEVEMPQDVSHEYSVVEAAFMESTLRETMITNEALAVKALFTDYAAAKWRAFAEANLSREQIRDFFVGSVQLRGPVDAKASVSGFYNPWWDAVLVAEHSGEKSAVKGSEGTTEDILVRRVSDFRFLSGESFRNEPHKEVPSVESVIPGSRLIPMVVADLTTRTRRCFDEMYADGVALLADHQESETKENVREIQIRSALRMKMARNLMSNDAHFKEAWQLAKVLKDGRKGTFNLLFSSDYARMMTEKFVSLPKMARMGFEPYGYYSADDGSNVRTYVYVNARHPRLFAVAHLGLGLRKTVFEWFDFSRAGDIVKAFQTAEEVRK